MNRIVSNQEFEEELNQPNTRNIFNIFLNPPRKYISKQELYSLRLITLWEAMASFDVNKSKFSTHLINYCRWKYLDFLKEKEKRKNKTWALFDVIDYRISNTQLFDFEESISDLDEQSQKIVKMRFLDDMSYKEIGDKLNYSSEYVRLKLKKIYSFLRNQLEQ